MAEYIEREALIRYTEKQEVIIVNGTSIADAMRIQGNVFRKCIETAPASDVAEVKHGKWTSNGLRNPQCSLCRNYNIEKSRFCPNCGARMEARENDG